jgi:hypothetical protein
VEILVFVGKGIFSYFFTVVSLHFWQVAQVCTNAFYGCIHTGPVKVLSQSGLHVFYLGAV